MKNKSDEKQAHRSEIQILTLDPGMDRKRLKFVTNMS